ncbi:hypothetical protein L1987_39309 [Smallanthus sonchifolius]|uniref:Uncharacterized protein n=1 Tax=Smallanthus sonchifolius TaxID=185202 RepID=A0ACB9HN05_9ASTR|nr:hypothetical protein L1987_39309 [Smallanthus sonchifolius]
MICTTLPVYLIFPQSRLPHFAHAPVTAAGHFSETPIGVCDHYFRAFLLLRLTKPVQVTTYSHTLGGQMSKGLIWATAEDLSRNRGRVLSLYRQVLRRLNSPDLPLNLAARLHRKAQAQARAIFMVAAEERSIHNIKDLIDVAEYSLSLLRKGEIPKYIQ